MVFDAEIEVGRVRKPRRLTKTLLKSRTLAESAGMYYAVSCRTIVEDLRKAGVGSAEDAQLAVAQMEKAIRLPWENQANRRRRHAPPHWNDRFLKLLVRK